MIINNINVIFIVYLYYFMCIFLFYFYVLKFFSNSIKPESPLPLHLHHIILQTLFVVTNNVTIAEIVEQVWRKAVPLETFGKKNASTPESQGRKVYFTVLSSRKVPATNLAPGYLTLADISRSQGKVRITSNNPFPVNTGHRLLATHSLEEILIVGNCMGTKTWERHCDVRFSPLFAAQPRSISREVTCWQAFLLHVKIFLPASTFLSSVWLKVYLLFLK